MKLHRTDADILIPDGLDIPAALERTTHLGIGAHQDDLEPMAIHGILNCFSRPERWFTGITCTDGAGSPRAGLYAHYTDEDMKEVRRREQRTAACIGRYGAMIQLGYPSRDVKDPSDTSLQEDLVEILKVARPRFVYTHNPVDKHDTHVAVAIAGLQALRCLAPAARPEKVYGCEVWRSLDWVPDQKKVVLDVGGRDHLAAALTGVYDSQIAGGKRYDLAVSGRVRANATYLDPHAVDRFEAASYALDLTAIIEDERLNILEYVLGLVDAFREAVRGQLRALLGPAAAAGA